MKTIYCRFATRTVAGGLIIAFAASAWVFGQESLAPIAPPAYKAEDPANRSLDANLFMETSAEYRACSYQAYNLALFRLKEALAKQKTGKFAVVMDLDETAVDNSGFQAMQLRSGLAYDQRLWDAWEEEGFDKVGLIPGAKEFILEARELRVAIVYISNRNEKFRKETKKALIRLGIWDEAAEAVDPAKADKLLKLSTGPTDKTTRRQEAEREYTVLLYIGDNLRDFDEALAFDKMGFGDVKKLPDDKLEAVIKARKDAVDKDPTIWGKEWIILPNPAYGEWPRALGRGKKDYDRLTPTATPTPTPAAPK